MDKHIKVTGKTATCYTLSTIGEKLVIAQIKNATWTFNYEGCSNRRLAEDCVGNGWAVKAQSLFRAAILKTRTEDYEGPTIAEIKEDFLVKEFDVVNDFTQKAMADPYGAALKKMDALSDEERARLFEHYNDPANQ